MLVCGLWSVVVSLRSVSKQGQESQGDTPATQNRGGGVRGSRQTFALKHEVPDNTRVPPCVDGRDGGMNGRGGDSPGGSQRWR